MYSHNYYSDLRTKCISSTLPRRGSWRQTSNTWCNYNILPTSSFSLLTGIQRTMKLQRLQLFAQHRILTKKNQETVRPRPTKLIRLLRGKCSNCAYNGDVVITRVRIVARTLLLLLLIMSTKRSLHNNRVTGSNKLVLNNRFHSIYLVISWAPIGSSSYQHLATGIRCRGRQSCSSRWRWVRFGRTFRLFIDDGIIERGPVTQVQRVNNP